MVSPMAQMVKNLPIIPETWVRSLSQEESPGKGMATHSSIFVWRIPWREEPSGLQSMGSQRVIHDWWSTHTVQLTSNQFNSVQFSHSVVSDSLQPHELQHARPSCLSPTAGVHPNHVHWVSDATQPSHPLSSPSPPAFNLSQH